ncbi:hypothetical protein H6F75_00310 [Nodosilinea sp. FACHB-131]|uniref:hypothetical protein n=1 Tax=Cyanophyceae TaxID=3028117 RepID=UPI001688DFBA|nr:hypothetical protein [Nodosilinea sp. FACHB-131]MBD1871912.1 hypothetical protein [Nodosilinea sp. FACHB-131]
MTHLIGLIDPPTTKLKPFTRDELIAGQQHIDELSKDYGFKPGAIKCRSTQSYTRALTIACIRALNRRAKIETVFPASETYNAATGRSGDILGIVDAIVLEVSPPRNRWVQACGKDWQPHIRKMCDYDHINRCRQVLANPTHTLELWGWAQYDRTKADGSASKQKFWMPRVQIITMDFLLGAAPPAIVPFFEASVSRAE